MVTKHTQKYDPKTKTLKELTELLPVSTGCLTQAYQKYLVERGIIKANLSPLLPSFISSFQYFPKNIMQ